MAVWRPRTWPLRYLTEEQYAFWEENGYLVVPDVVHPDLAANTAQSIREFVGADNSRPEETWYTNTMDIYCDVLPNGKKPLHGPCGMVQMYHHSTLWEIRQEPSVHAVFSDLYGTHELYVTTDRAHFKPPENSKHPAWSNPGEVHNGLHWDIETTEPYWPVPFAIQGVVYLEDTKAEQGSLRVVPGFHKRLQKWSSEQPKDRSGRECPESLSAEAVATEGKAGSLIVWLSVLPHGPGRNISETPRISAYVAMLPVDASPFLGPGRRSDLPLSMSDAGTVDYDDMEKVSSLKRLDGVARVEKWQKRLPLLREDPQEDDLPRRPPGEDDGKPALLTPLGKRLVGLVKWEAEYPCHICQAGEPLVSEAAVKRARLVGGGSA
eukprot:TRINITY_DN3021_c1_g1_i2.p1 TRINITY_DN3021_c1_g1~~TRINITY_DN3021_c1_g1_i2.p1  ORF type:complete len:387 (-),score=49.59 TRINITY_DN3021_c1_g1_i2:1212-2345(-)